MNTKSLIDPSIPRITAVPDDALVTITDKQSGAVSTIEFSNLMKEIKRGIQIGGRNYFAMSKAILVNATKDGYSLNMVYPDARNFLLYVSALKSGGEYTNLLTTDITSDGRRSFSLSIPDDCVTLLIKHNGATQDFGARIPISSPGKYMLSITFSTESGAYSMSEIMLEKGNIASDWTPAPEDLGGVKPCPTIGYKTIWKGGWQHEQSNERANILKAERLHAASNGLSRLLRKSGHMYTVGYLPHNSKLRMRKSSFSIPDPLEICVGRSHDTRYGSIPTSNLRGRLGIPYNTKRATAFRLDDSGTSQLARKEVVAA